MTLNERISKVCKDKKVSQIHLVNLGCGSKQTVNSVLHGRQTPNSKFLEVFINDQKDINARWLLTGEEEMILEEPREKYAYCKECIKKEGVVEFLKKELSLRDKRIEELIKEAESQTETNKEAS
jgi:hypothetical protein